MTCARAVRPWLIVALALTGLVGCQSVPRHDMVCPPPPKVRPQPMPRELAKTALPDYVVEPPDILLIDAIKVVPLPPYRVHTLDTLVVFVAGALPEQPIDGEYTVESGGLINLGPPYGSVNVADLTLDEATTAVEKHLRQTLAEPRVTLQLGSTIARQQIAGEHLVGPDGMVSLGTYGKVFVAGMTQSQVRATIESHLSQYLEKPEVAVDVFAYNSKFYYVVTQGAGLGDGVSKFSITGNETVLDAIAEVNGLEAVSSKRIWVARPSDASPEGFVVLPVDWQAVTELGSASTNYQLMPGDRVFIQEDHLVAMDTWVSKVISPFERIAGFVSLSTQTVSGVRFFHQGRNGNFNNNF
jgi:polysaccharide export outer membrane protein